MIKSKKFWAVSAFISLAVMAFAGYSLYGRISPHFAGDTIKVRSAPVPVPQEGDENASAREVDKVDEEEDEDIAGRETSSAAKSETDKIKAVKTVFEYKDANARSVLIAGSFTSWKDKKMTKKNGVWKTEVYILPGTYPYHFNVDGRKKLAPGKPKAPTGDSLISVN